MDARTGKSKRRRVRKTRIKPPSEFTLRMTTIFGNTYLENSRGINIAIFLILALLVGMFLLPVLFPPQFDFALPDKFE